MDNRCAPSLKEAPPREEPTDLPRPDEARARIGEMNGAAAHCRTAVSRHPASPDVPAPRPPGLQPGRRHCAAARPMPAAVAVAADLRRRVAGGHAALAR